MPELATEQEEARGTDQAAGLPWLNLLVLALVTVLVVAGVWWFQSGGSDGEFSQVEVEAVAGAPPRVGDVAPQFGGLLTTGETVDLESLRGKPVWLVFNATWCANCRSEAPEVQALHDAGDVEVISVWLREASSQVIPYMERTGMSFTSVSDPTGQISNRYQVRGVPSHYLIDAEGVLRSVHVGALTHTQFEQYSQDLLTPASR